jgi:ribosome-associated translation inhibitor RaiA
MNLPLQITFHDVQPSPAVAARIREAAGKLERFHARIVSCRVIIEPVARHTRRGHPYRVRIELHVPGSRIVIRRQPARRPSTGATQAERPAKKLEGNSRHKDLYVAIHDAFESARRRLEDQVRIQRDVKKLPRLKAVAA